MITSDVSDAALRAVKAVGDRTGVPGEYIVQVWASETGFKPLNPGDFGGTDYFGPAAVMGSLLPVSRSQFASLSLEDRIPLLEGLLRDQVIMNKGEPPSSAAVLYALNLLPGRVNAAGGNPSDDTVLIDRGGLYWADNPALHPYADPSGVTVGSMKRLLDAKLARDPRTQELLSRYRSVSGSFVGTVKRFAPVLVGGTIAIVAAYYLFGGKLPVRLPKLPAFARG